MQKDKLRLVRFALISSKFVTEICNFRHECEYRFPLGSDGVLEKVNYSFFSNTKEPHFQFKIYQIVVLSDYMALLMSTGSQPSTVFERCPVIVNQDAEL